MRDKLMKAVRITRDRLYYLPDRWQQTNYDKSPPAPLPAELAIVINLEITVDIMYIIRTYVCVYACVCVCVNRRYIIIISCIAVIRCAHVTHAVEIFPGFFLGRFQIDKRQSRRWLSAEIHQSVIYRVFRVIRECV